MPLSDAFARSAKVGDKAAAKFSDGDDTCLLVTVSGKCWRLDYRYLGKRKTLELGIYPEVSLAKARTRALDARTLLADGRPG